MMGKDQFALYRVDGFHHVRVGERKRETEREGGWVGGGGVCNKGREGDRGEREGGGGREEDRQRQR